MTPTTFEEAIKNPDNNKIMNSVIRRFNNQISGRVLEQCKMLGLWKALKSHDFSQKRKFTTSLYKFVLWECLKEIRSKTLLKTKKDKLDEYIHLNSFDNPPQINLPLNIMEKLSSYDRELLYDRFYLSLTYKEMGEQRGTSKQVVNHRLRKVLQDIRNGVYGSVEI